mmetsp:Transcript_60991/g.180529  ORF Transcript_60991/g.180529 Transcript_60991/m.180529 type:complete len:176 (-) Transcript_60991:221-748(-)
MVAAFPAFVPIALVGFFLSTAWALSLPKPPKVSRRQVLNSAVLLLSPSALPQSAAVAAEESKTDEVSDLLGTYTDPINHPGGFRKIELVGTGVGGYQLAKVTGGGGRGEPKSYELPAMVFKCPGNRQGLNRAASGKTCITIDFTPKGGPKDFTGYWDGEQKGIRFILDNNFWPQQ